MKKTAKKPTRKTRKPRIEPLPVTETRNEVLTFKDGSVYEIEPYMRFKPEYKLTCQLAVKRRMVEPVDDTFFIVEAKPFTPNSVQWGTAITIAGPLRDDFQVGDRVRLTIVKKGG